MSAKRFAVALAFSLIALLPARPSFAVDLATAFGIGGVQFPAATPNGVGCFFQATHAGNTSNLSVNITANGVDSAVVTLLCGGVSFTGTLPSIDVNGHQVSTVAFPQTVTSSAPGTWTVTVAGKIAFTVTAQ